MSACQRIRVGDVEINTVVATDERGRVDITFPKRRPKRCWRNSSRSWTATAPDDRPDYFFGARANKPSSRAR